MVPDHPKADGNRDETIVAADETVSGLPRKRTETISSDSRGLGSVHHRSITRAYQMKSTFSKFGGRARLAAMALLLAMPTTASHAYTVEQEEMCSGDAMRLCFSEIPNVERITACMERQRESLSEGCKAVFEVNSPAAATPPPVHTASPPHTASAHNKQAAKQTAKPSKPVSLTPKPKHD
jgi:hypothetical protein